VLELQVSEYFEFENRGIFYELHVLHVQRSPNCSDHIILLTCKIFKYQALIRKYAPVAIVIGVVLMLFWLKNKIWWLYNMKETGPCYNTGEEQMEKTRSILDQEDASVTCIPYLPIQASTWAALCSSL
jgi:hypothetical protein